MRLQLHALSYNLANTPHTLGLPEEVKHWSLTTLRDRLVKIGARIVRHGLDRLSDGGGDTASAKFRPILAAIAALRPLPWPAAC